MRNTSDTNPYLKNDLTFKSKQDAVDFLGNMRGINDVKHFTYLGVNIPEIGARRDYVVSTYSPLWAERYFDKNYQNIDPVVSQGITGILPFDWSPQRFEDRKIKNFFGESSEFGVGRQGMSIPIRGPSGETALFSINTDLSDKSWKDFKQEATPHIMMLAYYFHQAIISLESTEPTEPHLSPRQKEALIWASRGKTIWETAAILGLSTRTVSMYLSTAQVELQAVNKVQAVAKAVRYNLLI